MGVRSGVVPWASVQWPPRIRPIPDSTVDLHAAELSPSEDERTARNLVSRNLVVQGLYSRHHSALLGFLRRLLGNDAEAQDIAQESYLRLCRQDGDLEKIRGHERSYLFKAAHNLLRDRRRRQAVRSVVQVPSVELGPDEEAVDGATPATSLELKQTMMTVRLAVDGMSPEVREVFMLRRSETLTYRQIAQRLGIAERTVERRMHKALSHLKEEMLRAETPLTDRSGAAS